MNFKEFNSEKRKKKNSVILEDFDIVDIETSDEQEQTVNLFDGYLGEQSSVPNPLEYGPNATYRNLREGVVYKKGPDNLWEVFLQDGKPGRNGQSAPGGGCGVTEVNQLIDIKLENVDVAVYKDDIGSGEIGFNAYFMFTEYLRNIKSDDNGVMNYVSACGGKVIRTLYPCFQKDEYFQYVFSNGIPDRDYTDSDFLSTFLTKSDWLFDIADLYKIKLHLGLFWDRDEMAKIGNSTVSAAFSSTTTDTAKFMIRFAVWLSKRYNKRDSYYVISLCNEWPYNYAGYPTDVQLGDLFGTVAKNVHTVCKDVKVTANMDRPIVSVTKNRRTIDTYVKSLQIIFKDLDLWTVHVYFDSNYFGYHDQILGGLVTPSSANNYGYEYIDGFVDSLVNAAKNQGKELVVGEFGMFKQHEVYTETTKKRRILNAVRSAKYSLLWNLNSTDRAIVYNNPNSSIDPYTDTVWSTLIQEMGKFSKEPTNVIFPRYARQQSTPKEYFRTSTSANNTSGVVYFASTNKLSADNMASMFWIKINSSLSALQGLVTFNPSYNNAILWLGSNSQDGSIFDSYRTSGASNGSGSTIGMPILTSARWYHFASIPRTSTPYICDVFVDGMYWNSHTLSGVAKGLTSGTCVMGAGATSEYGAPADFQDITLIPNANYQDILNHMNGQYNPKSVIHIRTTNGIIEDITPNPVTIITGSSVTTGYYR